MPNARGTGSGPHPPYAVLQFCWRPRLRLLAVTAGAIARSPSAHSGPPVQALTSPLAGRRLLWVLQTALSRAAASAQAPAQVPQTVCGASSMLFHSLAAPAAASAARVAARRPPPAPLLTVCRTPIRCRRYRRCTCFARCWQGWRLPEPPAACPTPRRHMTAHALLPPPCSPPLPLTPTHLWSCRS
jgi:hypothetical protein